jgi:hypothetical protein
LAFCNGAGEIAHEGVSGGGGVHGLNRVSGQVYGGCFMEVDEALLAEGDNDVAIPGLLQLAGGLTGLFRSLNGLPAQEGGLDFIRD